MWAGFNMFIFISALQAVPKDLYEYAEIEGASKTVTFFKITLPLIAPAMTTVVTLSVSGGLKVFDIIYVLTNGGPGFDTQVLSTYSSIVQFGVSRGIQRGYGDTVADRRNDFIYS